MKKRNINSGRLRRTKTAWIDSETTGLDTKKSDIWQLAVLVEEGGEVIDAGNWLMRPREEGIEEGALELQEEAITKEYLMSLPEQAQVFQDFIAFMSRHVDRYDKWDKFVPAGYFVRFDLDFMREWFLRNGDKYFGSWFFNGVLEVSTFGALATLEGERFTNYKLSTLCEKYGISLDAHDALSDIKATRELYARLREERRQDFEEGEFK